MQIPDAPYIREAELNGMPPYEETEILCPVCGAEAESYFVNLDGDILGCDECMRMVDAFEWTQDHREEYEP